MIASDWFAKWAVYSPAKIAFRELESGRSFTFSEFNRMGNHLAAMLRDEYHFTKGKRLAIISEYNIEYIVLFAVAQKLGITLVPLNYRLTSHELDFVIGNADVKGIVFDNKFLDKISQLDCYKKITVKFSMEQLVTINNNCIKQKLEAINVSETFDENDPIFILYTSGTTAFPKGALYTHKMLFWNSINTGLHLNLTADDISVNCAPPFHTGGWNVLLAPFIHHGAFTLLMQNFDADLLLEVLESEKATIWWAVPTMLKMMAESPVFEKVKLDKLRYFIVGGESMPIPLIEKWHKKGVLIRQGYGLTEVGPNVSSLNHEDAIRKKGSIGTMNFYYDAKLVDENFKEVKPGEPGELVLNGPTVTPGYWKNEKATDENIKNGWFHTGDLMTVDEDGFYFVVDRIKNMYISGGENVYPAEVENVILSHPAVANVAIVGVPDEKWGESGKAFVVLKDGKTFNQQEMFDYCVERMAKYKVPKHWQVMVELPKNDAGKIDRKKLKQN